MKYYAGVELEDSAVKCSIIARDGTLLCRDKIEERGEGMADCASRLILMLTQRANVPLTAIGIVGEDAEGAQSSRESAALLAERVKERFAAPVLLIGDFNVNDFNASAFGD